MSMKRTRLKERPEGDGVSRHGASDGGRVLGRLQGGVIMLERVARGLEEGGVGGVWRKPVQIEGEAEG